MNRLQKKIQTEIALLQVKMKSEPAVADKLARLQAELARLELVQQEPA